MRFEVRLSSCRVRSEKLKSHPGYPAYGGYYREEAILMLRRFYLNQNVNGMHRGSEACHTKLIIPPPAAPKPRVKTTRVLKTEFLPIPTSSISRTGTPVGRTATP